MPEPDVNAHQDEERSGEEPSPPPGSQPFAWEDVERVLGEQPIQQVPFGQYVVNVGAAQGGVVDFASPQEGSAADHVRPRREPPRILPRRVPGFVDREKELARIGQALSRGQVVDLYGPDGVGKTALISEVMHGQLPGTFPDGMVYLSAGHETYEDLLRGIFGSFFDTDGPIKVSENDVRTFVAGKRALLVIDDANHLGEREADALIQVAPQCAILVAGRKQQLWQGVGVSLRGLPNRDAVALFEQHWGPVSKQDRPKIEAICTALDHVPLAIIQVARLASGRQVPLDQVLQEVQARSQETDPVAQAFQTTVALLSEGERLVLQVLTALAAAHSDPVYDESLDVTGLSSQELRRYLARLEALGLVTKEDNARHSLSPAAGMYIVSPPMYIPESAAEVSPGPGMEGETVVPGSRVPDQEAAEATAPYGPLGVDLDLATDLVPGVLVLNMDPVVRSEGNRRLHEVLGWEDPRRLAEAYIAHLAECSEGYVRYQIAQWVDVDAWPAKVDGFRYDEETFLRNWRSRSGWHQPDAVDYEAILADFDLPGRVEAGQIDEVWLFGPPYAGFYESVMVGPDAFWCNAPPIPRSDVSRCFAIMGFNYERGAGPMLESFGHRVEAVLKEVYDSWEPAGTSPWDRFIQYDRRAPGWAGCGWMHYAPNSVSDYDWGNRQLVWSTCDEWLKYPDLRGSRRQVNCEEWGDGDMLAHHLWWLRHLPHAPGRSQGVLNNWWAYAITLHTEEAAALDLGVTAETLPRDGHVLLELLAQNAASGGAGRLLRSRQEREKAGMRRAIAGVLGELVDEGAVDPLVELLQDRESDVRLAAAQALGQIGDVRAVDALDKATREDGDERVREAATAALNRIDPLPHVGRLFADQYEIVQELEPGGLTAAYRARDVRLEREVVLKVVQEPPETPTFLPTFEREADTFTRLQHPNLVRVLGYNVTWPRPFYDREPVGDERTLRDLLAERGRLSLAEALPILEQVADALDYLHAQEPPVFHLHLKPGHVLLAGEGEALRAVLTDSIPTRAWQRTQTGDLVGTPGYISPEMVRGALDEIGPRTDVYGLGLIAYELLAGQAPFEGYTPLAVVQAHAEEPPPSPRQFAPDLSDEVSAVLLKALAKSPDERYPTNEAFVSALQEAVAAVPEPQFWFVTANPQQYDWNVAFDKGSEQWTEVRGAEAQQNLRQARPGDVVLTYRSSPDRYVAGLGHIAGRPYEHEDRYAVQIDADLKFETGVTLDELRQATPDLQHVTRPRPLSFSPVTAEQWAAIRELILYHNPGLSAEDLPPTTIEAEHGLDIEAVELLDDLVVGERAHVTLRLRNRGSLTWPEGEQIQVSCAWQREDSAEPLETRWVWLLEIALAVPPGGPFEASDVGETVTLPPGRYRAGWAAWGPGWEEPAELPRLVRDVQILAEARTGLRVAVQVPDGLVLRADPSISAPAVGRLPYGQVLDVLDDLQEGLDRVGIQDQWLHVRSPEGAEGYAAAWYVSLVGYWSAAAVVHRLSAAAETALRYAEAFRRTTGSDTLDTPHLLAGLYRDSEGPARRLLTLFDDEGTARARVEEWANWPTHTELPLAAVEPVPEGLLSPLTFSPNAEKGLLQAAILAEERNVEEIGSGYLLAGLLAVPESLASQRIVDLLQVDREQLYALVAENPDALPPLDRIREISGRRTAFLTHESAVTTLAFALEGQMLASGSLDGTVRLWDVGQGRLMNEWPPLPGPIVGVALNPDGTRLVAASDEATIQVRDLSTGDVTTATPAPAASEARDAEAPGLLTALSLSADGALLATGFVDGTIQLTGLPQLESLGALYGHTGTVAALSFAADGQSLVSAAADNTLKAWDLRSSREQRSLAGHRERVSTVAVTPDGRWAVSGAYDRSVRIWDLQTGQELLTLHGHDGPVLAVAVAFERRWVVSAAADATLWIWDLDTGRPLAALRGHGGGINAVAVSPGGRTVASGSNDRTIRLWNLDEVAAGLPRPISHEEALARLAFTQTDLLELPADAWLNSTSSRLSLGNTGQKLAQILGPRFELELREKAPQPVGTAIVTPVEEVPTRYILSVPIYDSAAGESPTASTVARAVQAALRQAEALPEVRTLVIPSIGTTWGGLFAQAIAPAMIETVLDHLRWGSRLQKITFSNPVSEIHVAFLGAYIDLGGKIQPPYWLARLSTSSRQALGLAEALRQRLGADLLTTDHLLWGLYQKESGATRLLLTTFDGHEQIAPLLDTLVGAPEDIAGLRPVPERALTDVLLDPDCQRAMEEAARLPTQDGIIPERHLLAGLLAAPESRTAGWIADRLGLIAAQLEFVAQTWQGQEEIAILPDLVRQARRAYVLLLGTRPREATAEQAAAFTVGQSLYLHVDLLPGIPGRQGAFALPEGITELYCFLAEASGLHIAGSAVAALPLALLGRQPPRASFDLQARLPGSRPYTVELFGEHPDRGGQALAQARGQVSVVAPQAGEEIQPLQPILDLRVAARPDLVLLVETALPEGDEGPRRLTYRLTCRLPGLRINNEEVGQVTLQPADLTQIRTLVHHTVVATAGLQPEDVRARMHSLGRYLFDRLFPAGGAATFRQSLQQAQEFWQSHQHPGQLPPTWLIVQEEATWLPWELVAPYRLGDDGPVAPLAELYRLGRWVEGLGQPLYGEVPLGDKVLAYYQVLTPEQAEQNEELLSWRQVLDAGAIVNTILPVVKPETNFYGLHLLRHADQVGRARDIMVRNGTLRRTSAEDEAQRGRLDLHLRRPVVTLSILDGQGPSPGADDDEWLLPERVLPFLRAGASAVLGPWWPTSEAADREFWATFYDYVAGRMPLGEAVWRARYAVQRKFPERPDWLAYTLLGDPRARPYVPEKSEGYTALECLNAEEDGTLRPGKTYTFRASIQRRPPVWYQQRVVETEPLPEQAWVRFIPIGLQDPLQANMEPDQGRTIAQATMELVPSKTGDHVLMAQIFSAQDLLATLQLTLQVRDEPSGG